MRITQNSFTGGEISRPLDARNDLAKYSNGLKCLKNGFVQQEGAVSNRAGLEFIRETKVSSQKSRLIPFAFNTEQTYVLEVGNNYFRFIKDGGYIIYPDDYEDETKRGQVVEVETPYATDEIPLLKYAQNADVLTICHPNHPQIELSRNSHYDWTITSINFQPKIAAPQNVSAKWTGKTENPRSYSYLVTAVNDDDEESNRSKEVNVKGRYESYWAVGEYMTLTWDKVDEAIEYNIYRSVNGVYGYIGTSTTNTFTDEKIEPDLSSTAPIAKNPFKDNLPSVVNYFQQRKVYANTKNNPQTIYTSQTGTSDNFNVSRPLVASDAITITLSEREVNEIRHLVAMNDLVVLTSSAEWKVNGTDGAFSASPPPVAKPQSYYGCSHVMPVVSGNMILFVQAGGSVLRDLGYTYVSDSYDGDELTIFANHLFKGKQIIDMAYSKEPFRIVWCVLSDGKLAGLTYNRKQEISGWHKHETDGEFESVVCIRENYEDVAYFIVKREINGETKRYVERMATRIVNKATDSIFLDCALKYDGEPIKVLYGLEHLEGKRVNVNADGGFESHVVENGSVTLDDEASIISVGLPYEFDFETLNIEGENTHGIKKIINSLNIKINESREDFIVVGTHGEEVQCERSIESIDDASLLLSKDCDAIPFSGWVEEATIHIKQNLPYPLTILSVSAVVDIEDISR